MKDKCLMALAQLNYHLSAVACKYFVKLYPNSNIMHDNSLRYDSVKKDYLNLDSNDSENISNIISNIDLINTHKIMSYKTAYDYVGHRNILTYQFLLKCNNCNADLYTFKDNNKNLHLHYKNVDNWYKPCNEILMDEILE